MHTIVGSVMETETVELEPGNVFQQDFEILFCKCRNCEHHSLFSMLDGDPDVSWSLYPKEIYIDESVPKGIKDAYLEALKIKKTSKVAFVVMIRRALELLCKHESAVGRSLYEKINDLGAKDVIPKKLSQMADAIRLLGNDGAHENSGLLEEDDIEILDKFYSTIIEYVYIAPKKLDALKKKVSK
ncbi:MAG: DUF4145 domain-containing protein [Cyclobacteriaceae bacterium]|nr:MAG: DUF4145 domain-containing protein [Cyclobacteriaceae bacterium]